MTKYTKGRRFEYKVKKILESAGYLVIRSAASKQVDLVAIAEDHVLLLECKTYKPTPKLIRDATDRFAKYLSNTTLFFFVYPSDKAIHFIPVFARFLGDNNERV